MSRMMFVVAVFVSIGVAHGAPTPIPTTTPTPAPKPPVLCKAVCQELMNGYNIERGQGIELAKKINALCEEYQHAKVKEICGWTLPKPSSRGEVDREIMILNSTNQQADKHRLIYEANNCSGCGTFPALPSAVCNEPVNPFCPTPAPTPVPTPTPKPTPKP